MWFIIHVCNDVAPGCLFIGHRWDLPPKASRNPHARSRGFYIYGNHALTNHASNVFNPVGIPAKQQASDAMTHQASFPG
jgi:hypothetical protein